jgi:hypothetical protein
MCSNLPIIYLEVIIDTQSAIYINIIVSVQSLEGLMVYILKDHILNECIYIFHI